MKIFIVTNHKGEINYFINYAIAELIKDNYNKNLSEPEWEIVEQYINNSQLCPTTGICKIPAINFNCDCAEVYARLAK